MILIHFQAYYVTWLPNYLRIISTQVIRTSKLYKGELISHCHDKHDSYAELNFKEDNTGQQKAKPVDRVYIKYDPKNNLPTHENILPNQIQKTVKALESFFPVFKRDNQNLTTLKKEILQWHFILGHIGFQHVQWLICTWSLKVQGNSKEVSNFERLKYSAFDFGKGHHRSNKVDILEISFSSFG